MPVRQHTLTDVAHRTWLESFAIGPAPDLRLTGSERWSVTKHVLRGGLADGVDVVELDNGRLSLSILPTRGMGIWRGLCDGLELGWKSPVEQPVHPAFVESLTRGGIGWLAGFNEWICRCGLDCNGPPGPDGPLHGRIANIPAHTVEVLVDTAGAGAIAVRGIVDEASMFGPNLRLVSQITTEAGSSRISVHDEITNRGGTPADLELLYHINTGPPFLEAGSRCVVSAIEVAPRDTQAAIGINEYSQFPAPDADYAEQVYYFELAADAESRTSALLRNARGDKGLSLHFDKRQLPRFILWKNTRSEADGYVSGLEPATNYPNAKSFEREQGRVIRLPPRAKYVTQLEIAIHSSAPAVHEIERQIGALSQGQPPIVHPRPRPDWSPGA
jgi:hypothetical protein